MYICIFVEHETSKEIMRNRESNGLTRRKGIAGQGRVHREDSERGK